MGVATALCIAAAAVAAVGAVGAAAMKKQAADKAATAQQHAIKGQAKILNDELSYSKVNQAAVTAERDRAKARIALQEEVDPELAQMRQLGKQQLLAQAQEPNASKESVQVASQLFNENIKSNAGLEKLKDQIIGRAQEKLDQGATLPPEFQGELVRAGISQGSQAGLRAAPSTIGGHLYQALGSAGIALQAQREQQASSLAQTAQGLQDSRAKILESIFPTISQTENTARQNAATTFGVADAEMPQAGLTGAEAANLQINKGNTLIKLRGKAGAVQAQKAIAGGEANAAYVKAGANFASSALGAYGGGGGSVGGSIGAGGNYAQSSSSD